MTEVQSTGQPLDFGMTELEEHLASPDGAARKAETLGVLLSAGQRVKAAMDAGLPKQDFETAQKTYTALAAAHEVVGNFPAGASSQD